MPIYEYRCANCGVIEVPQKITEGPLLKCPTCEAKILRLISATGSPKFNGSGFYATDYSKKKN